MAIQAEIFANFLHKAECFLKKKDNVQAISAYDKGKISWLTNLKKKLAFFLNNSRNFVAWRTPEIPKECSLECYHYCTCANMSKVLVFESSKFTQIFSS